MSHPKVSVLMPVYNADCYVAKAVESILTQTFSDFELLVIDDGSTDDSLSVLEDVSKKDSRVKLTSRANTGYVIALNEMLERASGEFVARMDADDIAMPTRFALQVERLVEEPSVVVVGTHTMLVDPENRDLCVLDVPCDHDQIDEKHLQGIGGIIAHPSSMFRVSALRAVGGYKPEFWPAEDVDLFLRLAEIGRLCNIPETGIRYRLHRESTGHRHRKTQALASKRAAVVAHIRRGLACPVELEVDGIDTEVDHCMTWAWWALQGGNVATARKYAFQAFMKKPVSLERVRLLYCALRGH